MYFNINKRILECFFKKNKDLELFGWLLALEMTYGKKVRKPLSQILRVQIY